MAGDKWPLTAHIRRNGHEMQLRTIDGSRYPSSFTVQCVTCEKTIRRARGCHRICAPAYFPDDVDSHAGEGQTEVIAGEWLPRAKVVQPVADREEVRLPLDRWEELIRDRDPGVGTDLASKIARQVNQYKPMVSIGIVMSAEEAAIVAKIVKREGWE